MICNFHETQLNLIGKHCKSNWINSDKFEGLKELIH